MQTGCVYWWGGGQERHHLIWRRVKEHLLFLGATSVCSGHSRSWKHPLEAPQEVIPWLHLTGNFGRKERNKVTSGPHCSWELSGKCNQAPLDPRKISLVLLRKCLCVSVYEIVDSKFWAVTEWENLRGRLSLLLPLCLSLPFLCSWTRYQETVSLELPLAPGLLRDLEQTPCPLWASACLSVWRRLCWALPTGFLEKYNPQLWHFFGFFLEKEYVVYRTKGLSCI